MYVRDTMGKCDCYDGRNGQQCQNRADIQAVARGATGRYCYVLGWCLDCFTADGMGMADTVSLDEAYKLIEERGDGYADF